MFAIDIDPSGAVKFSGRLDASQAPRASEALQPLSGDIVLDLSALDYISSAGLGILVATFNRLRVDGRTLIIRHPSNHVRHILSLARLDAVLTIQ